MDGFASLLLVLTCFQLVPGRDSISVSPSTHYVTTAKDEKLVCKFEEPQDECFWKGPNAQTVNSLKDYYNTEHIIQRQKGSLYCNLTFPKMYSKTDEGLWGCYSAKNNDQPVAVWRVVFTVKPKNPIIMFSNGTTVTNDINVYHAKAIGPGILLPLKCVSNNGKPAHESISWLINGYPPPHSTSYYITKTHPEGQFIAETTTSVVITSQEGFNMFSIANVTCIVKHATGQTNISKLFGIYDNQHVDVVQMDIPDKPGAKLVRCVTSGFPPPHKYTITGPNGDNDVQELVVTESGRYSCSAHTGSSLTTTSRVIDVMMKDDSGGKGLTATKEFTVILTFTTAVLAARHR